MGTKQTFSHVHFFSPGGAPIPTLSSGCTEEDKGVHFVQGYGMTESGRLTSLLLGGNSIRKAVRQGAFPSAVLRIVDKNDRDVAPEKRAEIILKVPMCSQY